MMVNGGRCLGRLPVESARQMKSTTQPGVRSISSVIDFGGMVRQFLKCYSFLPLTLNVVPFPLWAAPANVLNMETLKHAAHQILVSDVASAICTCVFRREPAVARTVPLEIMQKFAVHIVSRKCGLRRLC